MTAVVLHLSDIHIRSDKDWILSKGEQIAACTFASLPEATAVFVVISGDVAFSGKVAQYEAASKLFLKIRELIQAERKVDVHFIIAPGNHDCDFALSNKARLLTLNGVRQDISQFDQSVIDLGASIQGAYRQFEGGLATEGETRVGDSLLMTHRFTVEGQELSFDCINVAWCSNLHEDPGSLIFPVDRYQGQLSKPADLRIAVIHHPLNWFSQSSYHAFKKMVRGASNVVISGHEHTGGVGEDFNSGTGLSAYIEGCVLQSDNPEHDSSFNVAVINLGDGTYRSTRYLWSADDSRYLTTEEGSWEDFRSLPKKARNDLEITREFELQLEDPGGAFKAQGSPVTLAELYVYPDMQESISNRDTKKIIHTKALLDIQRLEGGVLLSGEEKVGSTSLLYMLYRHFHERGFVPVYVRGVDVKGMADKDLENALRKAVTEQYGNAAWAAYSQLSGSKKLLLLDDFDDGAIKGVAQRIAQLKAVANRFTHFIVTASEVFDFDSTVSPHIEQGTLSLTHYGLLPFGYQRRSQLVQRWFARTAGDGTVDDGDLLARCDQAERLLDAVMARNIVPALPLYLLTLLQSIDAGAHSGFDESGLGDYYDFLIKEGLAAAGVAKAKWGQVIEYCSHLAWQMHATEHKELSADELRAFNDKYSDDEVRVKLDQRIEELVRARILSRTNGYVRFRYHYIYYFLKGRYIESQLKLNDLAVQAHIRECCAHLYVRENANTILFLAHHASRNPMFIDCVVESLDAPFKSSTPVTFAPGDSGWLTDFIRGLPSITYSGEAPEAARERMNRARDEADDGSDGLADSKEDGAEHDFIAQMVALFKTLEVLGQILKNQTSGLSRVRRVELLTRLLCGPLRAVRAFFDIFTKDRDQVIAELAEMLVNRKGVPADVEGRTALAKQLLAHLLQTSAYSFFIKAIVSISSDGLQEDIDTAAKKINSPAARLISLGTKLDSPKVIPRAEMKKLLNDSTTDLIASRVLQMLTLRRLYMFKTSSRDRQWLASEKILTLKSQEVIEFTTVKSKVLK